MNRVICPVWKFKWPVCIVLLLYFSWLISKDALLISQRSGLPRPPRQSFIPGPDNCVLVSQCLECSEVWRIVYLRLTASLSNSSPARKETSQEQHELQLRPPAPKFIALDCQPPALTGLPDPMEWGNISQLTHIGTAVQSFPQDRKCFFLNYLFHIKRIPFSSGD